MIVLLLFLFFILGICFGSFVNMLVYRTAIKYKLESEKFKVKDKKRSFCDYCGRQLFWYENIPIFSWLFQNGKTRCCNKKLSISYPIVELITGIIFIILGSNLLINANFSWFYFLFLIIIVLLIFSTVFDLKYMILPDFSTVILIIIAFLGIIFDEKNIIPYLLSALISSGFLLLLNLITKGNGMGMGDVKLALFMGLFLGYPKIILAFYIAFIVGAILGIFLIAFKKVDRKSQIPFGPFLILGTLVSFLYGNEIIELLISNF